MKAREDLDTWLASHRERVDRALDRCIPAADGPTGPLVDAMRYSVFAGGKRLRPMLVLAAAEAIGERRNAGEAAVDLALPAACAIELIHTYSLVHDDLPAMDNDTMRRGRPTAHVVYGEGMAILSGDALLTEAFVLLAREPVAVDAERGDDIASRKLAALHEIAVAAGALGMAGGQAVDLKAALPGAAALDDEALHDMHARKTGALLRASAVAGAIMAGASAAELEAVGTYGRHIGLAFQIVDDILDVEGASAVLGKTAGKDAAAGKPTYPARYGLDESRRRADASIAQALDALASVGVEGQLPAIARWVVARTH